MTKGHRHSKNSPEPDAAVARDLAALPPVLTPEMVSTLVFGGSITTKTLANWRTAGRFARFRRQGHPTRGTVVYLKSDLVDYFSGMPGAGSTLEERLRVERTAA